MIKNSFTTHVVNYSNSVIIIKNVPCEDVNNAERYFTQMKLPNSSKNL